MSPLLVSVHTFQEKGPKLCKDCRHALGAPTFQRIAWNVQNWGVVGEGEVHGSA
jgi:hypothetical protein